MFTFFPSEWASIKKRRNPTDSNYCSTLSYYMKAWRLSRARFGLLIEVEWPDIGGGKKGYTCMALADKD